MTKRIEKLAKAIENEHNCNAKHSGSVYVTVTDGLHSDSPREFA